MLQSVAMIRAAKIIAGATVLLLVTFANPMAGNVLGFCPPAEGPKALTVDVIVAVIDISAAWLIYRGLRTSPQ